MRIGIDARLIQESGVGRYIRNLIRELSVIDSSDHFVVFLTKKTFDEFHLPNSRWEKRLADIRWHTVREQIVMPWIFSREHLDVLHVPYFNAPIFYPGKYILTIHDLTIAHTNTGLASTYPKLFYMFRRWGYALVLRLGIKRAKHIITVSHTVEREILKDFSIPPSQISVTYEGVDPLLFPRKDSKSIIRGRYFLYVGNAYPHKNLNMLITGYKMYYAAVKDPAKLILVGKRDFFYERLERKVAGLGLSDSVVFFGHADDITLQTLYTHALSLVFPSRMEGFGLPALEALALGCPVICSDIPIFHELLKENAVFVNTLDPDAIRKALISVHIKRPHVAAPPQFSWNQMAKTTLSIYQNATSL